MAQWSDSSDEEQQANVVTSIVPSSEEEESDGDEESVEVEMQQPMAYAEEYSDASSSAEEDEPKDVKAQEESSDDEEDDVVQASSSDEEGEADVKSVQPLKQEDDSEESDGEEEEPAVAVKQGVAYEEESSDEDEDEQHVQVVAPVRKPAAQQQESSGEDNSSEDEETPVVKDEEMSEQEESDAEAQDVTMKEEDDSEQEKSSDEDKQTVTTAEEDESSDESSDEEMQEQSAQVAAHESVEVSSDEDEVVVSTALPTTREEVVKESSSDESESSSEDEKERRAMKQVSRDDDEDSSSDEDLPTWKRETDHKDLSINYDRRNLEQDTSSDEDSSDESNSKRSNTELKKQQMDQSENEGNGSSDDEEDLEAENEIAVNGFVEESSSEDDEDDTEQSSRSVAKNEQSGYNIVDIVMEDAPDLSIQTNKDARKSPESLIGGEDKMRMNEEEDGVKPLAADVYEAQDALWLLHNIFTRVPVPEQTGINRGARPRGPLIQDPLSHVDEFKRKFRWPLLVRNLKKTNFTENPSDILLDHDIILNETEQQQFQERRTSAFASPPGPLVQAVAESVRKISRKRKRAEESGSVKTLMTATGLSNLVRVSSRFNDQFVHSLLSANADALQGTDESYPQRSWTPLPSTRKPIANWRFVVEHLHRKNQEQSDPLCPKLQPATLRRIRDRLSSLYGLSWQQEDNEFLNRLTQNEP